MQEAPSSCLVILIGILLVILLFLGLAPVNGTLSTEQIMSETADAIRATNAQVEIFLTQAAQARAVTPTPAN